MSMKQQIMTRVDQRNIHVVTKHPEINFWLIEGPYLFYLFSRVSAHDSTMTHTQKRQPWGTSTSKKILPSKKKKKGCPMFTRKQSSLGPLWKYHVDCLLLLDLMVPGILFFIKCLEGGCYKQMVSYFIICYIMLYLYYLIFIFFIFSSILWSQLFYDNFWILVFIFV